MYKFRGIYVLFLITLISTGVQGKKPKRGRRPTNEEDTTPQPSVVSYSTFGFNDVGSYDGFVPTSPDYANFLSNVNQESSTRLYAPAFPSAADPTGFNGNFGSVDEYGNNEDREPQSSMLQYPHSSLNFYSTPNFDNSHIQSKNIASSEIAEPTADGPTGPVYGTKIGSKIKKGLNQYNNTEFGVYSSGSSNDFPRFKPQEHQPAQDNKRPGESGPSDQNIPSYISNYPPSDGDEFVKSPANVNHGVNFPRVVDFTKMKQYYPTELDNKYQVATYSSIINGQNENMFSKINNEHINKFIQPTPTVKESPNTKPVVEETTKEDSTSFSNPDYSANYIRPIPTKTSYKGSGFNSAPKDNFKNKWISENNSHDNKNIRNPFKGYEYSTDYSNTSFKYDFTPDRKPLNSDTDELVPASSNIDFSRYNYPEVDFSTFKKIPEIKIPFEDDYDLHQSRDPVKSDEYINQFKNLYTTTPTVSSQWGNVFKSTDFSLKQRIKKPQYDDSTNNDVVHIPKRPQSSKFNHGKYSDSKANDYSKQRPYKSNKFENSKDWSKEVYNTRFKSEEDLLGLRNHDTSHPSYLPLNRPSSNEISDEKDYKKLVEKWRQSYLKSKYREAQREREYESYASDTKPIHVPIPKPYPIEVPHPVIVPVPQLYPVRIPVPKPVAVPVVRELTVPIEKPVPYPVIKKVPYPVEKLVPVPVEKEVPVPVSKPYPVHVPHVRPVFHHSRPPRDSYDSDEDDDYLPRPENNKKVPTYKKRIKSTRIRSRRPTRMTYHDRNTSKRRWPQGHRSTETRSRRPSDYNTSYRHRNFDTEREYENEPSDYYIYCKRTGNCK